MTDRYLLDTCAMVWMAEGSQMSDSVMDIIDDAGLGKVVLRVSPISAWEIGLLVAKGRLTMRTKPIVWFQTFCELPGIELAELNTDILIDSSFLPGKLPSDPADRIIISTARTGGMTIVTRDKKILSYAAQGNVFALEC